MKEESLLSKIVGGVFVFFLFAILHMETLYVLDGVHSSFNLSDFHMLLLVIVILVGLVKLNVYFKRDNLVISVLTFVLGFFMLTSLIGTRFVDFFELFISSDSFYFVPFFLIDMVIKYITFPLLLFYFSDRVVKSQRMKAENERIAEYEIRRREERMKKEERDSHLEVIRNHTYDLYKDELDRIFTRLIEFEMEPSNNLTSVNLTNEEADIMYKRASQKLKNRYGVNFWNLESFIEPCAQFIGRLDKRISKLERTEFGLFSSYHFRDKTQELRNLLYKSEKEFKALGSKAHTESKAISLGVEGEKLVNEQLELYDDHVVNIPSVYFKMEGKTSETDNFIVSPFGVFAIEVKNIGSSGNFSIKIERDGRWIKVKDRKETVMKNVTSQAYWHVGINQKIINKELKERGFDSYVYINPLIVLANETVAISNQSDVPVVRVSNMYHHMSSSPTRLSVEEQKAIIEIVKEHHAGSKKYGHVNPLPYYEEFVAWLSGYVAIFKKLETVVTEMEQEYTRVVSKEKIF